MHQNKTCLLARVESTCILFDSRLLLHSACTRAHKVPAVGGTPGVPRVRAHGLCGSSSSSASTSAFEENDRNNDGSMSISEFASYNALRGGSCSFSGMDTDGDDLISQAEFSAQNGCVVQGCGFNAVSHPCQESGCVSRCLVSFLSLCHPSFLSLSLSRPDQDGLKMMLHVEVCVGEEGAPSTCLLTTFVP